MTRYMLFLLTALLAPAWAQDEPPVALLPVQGDTLTPEKAQEKAKQPPEAAKAPPRGRSAIRTARRRPYHRDHQTLATARNAACRRKDGSGEKARRQRSA